MYAFLLSGKCAKRRRRIGVAGCAGLCNLFVYIIDGHHRVSVAKWLGIKELTAHVIEIQTEGAAQAKPAPPQVQNCWQAADC